ncbi:MFS transporter [Paenibacillus urinalis]|uniref:MFS transporter n=1 Tax=Paenibacillus urinalis TaxID=521520 RepID=A0ABY7XAD4_9BACL|nr:MULTISPECIES: MFS transporter [Paenibacillus]WDH98009.1 MFS transporter [Paenibacillus urinalis]WDI01691.1 MFS transporter [Paenibacillus urinalis]GAK42507.1 putative permease [Paenibacillus sp. TCA20]
MKTAVWLYLFLFLAFFDLHAQYPILTPFALSLGAVPTFIGWMMGIYSLTHLPGNLIAGTQIDKHGSRRYIVFSLTAAGIVLLLQSQVDAPWQLLALRAISGFVLAFLSPACMTLLAQLSSDPITQGKYMSGHGVVHTLASVVSPAAGAFIVAGIGFSGTFQSLGILLIITGIMAYFTLPAVKTSAANAPSTAAQTEDSPNRSFFPISWRFFVLPLVVACAQGILFFELPLRGSGSASILSTGLLFSIISLGALATLSMLFLNRYSPTMRLAGGVLLMAFSFFLMAAAPQIPLWLILFILGTSKGIIFPALASMLVQLSQGVRLGRVFSIQSIATSLGSFVGPIAAGQIRMDVSPYFLAFIVLMLGLLLLPFPNKFKASTLSHPEAKHV